MNQFFRKHWKHLFFTLATFFWVGCGDDSSSQAVLYGCPDDICKEDPETSSSGDLPASSSEEPSSSSSAPKMSSSSSYDDNTIPPMSATVYGIVPCFSTTVQNDVGVTFDIFECSNGKKYLQDGYDESIKDALPEGVETTPLVKGGSLAVNCTLNRTCTDAPDAEGINAGECTTSIECPPKEDSSSPTGTN